MKKNKIILMVITSFVAIISCNQIKEDKRVLIKGANDSLLVINIPTASCENCQNVIEGGLQNEKGIKQSLLNLNTKNVSIVYDPAITSPELIKTTVTQLTYKMPCK